MIKINYWLWLIVICVGYNFCADAKVYIVDGDSLELGSERIRLYGIDAPELFQDCYDVNEQKYRCGKKAKDFLADILIGKFSCKYLGVDKYGRSLKRCFDHQGIDINEQMVLSGWALSYGNDYYDAEQKARKKRKGVWQGKFMRPELFRAVVRNTEKRSENKKR